jgi:LysR family hydrogen peroxide-inducible transcriptional activator
MDLGQLRYFIKIVEHQSFTRAAQDCSVSQPALSQQIAKLEKELGQPLFERQGRTIEITTAGKLLKTHADKILQMVDDAKRQITDDGQTGRVTISAIPTVGPYLLPQLLKSIDQQFRSASFVVGEHVTADLLKRCSNGEINLAIAALPADAKYLSIEPLYEEELLLAMPRDHALSDCAEISIDDLRDEPFIFLNEAHCLVENIESFCNQQRFQPLVTTEIHQLVTVQNLVALGHGISFVPEMACQDNWNGKLVYRSLTGPKPTRTVVICSNPYRYQSQLLQNVLKAIRELLGDPNMESGNTRGSRKSTDCVTSDIRQSGK